MEKYSILMSVYCKEKPENLKKSIESMLNQTIKSDDFVLVCDGKLTYELEKVIEMYKSNLNIIRLKKNVGLGNALNEGLKFCKHEIVVRMDTDDISIPTRCEKQLRMFEKNPKLGLVSSNIEEFLEDENYIIGTRVVPIDNEAIIKFSKKRNPMNHPAVVLKKNQVESVGGYSEKFHLFEDYYLWVRMLQNGCVAENSSEYLLKMRTSKDMYKRRGGWIYAKNMLKFHWWMYREKWSSILDFFTGAIPHAAVCIMPNHLRKIIYMILH